MKDKRVTIPADDAERIIRYLDGYIGELEGSFGAYPEHDHKLRDRIKDIKALICKLQR